MDVYQILDITLYGVMVLDFIYKYLRDHADLKKLGEVKRYHPTFSKVKLTFYIAFLLANLAYIVYRIIMIKNGHLEFHKIAVVLPILCFQVLNDIIFGGIYYSTKGVYVKSTLILFGDVVNSYRHYFEDRKVYNYTIHYRPNVIGASEIGGQVEINFDVKNEPAAFELLTRLPMTNEE